MDLQDVMVRSNGKHSSGFISSCTVPCYHHWGHFPHLLTSFHSESVTYSSWKPLTSSMARDGDPLSSTSFINIPRFSTIFRKREHIDLSKHGILHIKEGSLFFHCNSRGRHSIQLGKSLLLSRLPLSSRVSNLELLWTYLPNPLKGPHLYLCYKIT